MNIIDKLALQKRHDIWALMYARLATSILDVCGRGGEYAVREALRRMGQERGEMLRLAHRNRRLKTDLINLYAKFPGCTCDPRLRGHLVKEDSEVRQWEVYSCPLAILFSGCGGTRVGSWFCEEYMHSLVSGYTVGKGQTNLDTRLTRAGDGSCYFSVYYREANRPDEQCETTQGDLQPDIAADCSEYISAHFIQTYYYLLETAQELYGDEGVRAIAVALRKLAPELACILESRADDLLTRIDQAFLKQNFPISVYVETDALWQEYNKHNAQQIMVANLLNPLLRELRLE